MFQPRGRDRASAAATGREQRAPAAGGDPAPDGEAVAPERYLDLAYYERALRRLDR
jgi:hypothetical protein